MGENTPDPTATMSLPEHLGELRERIVVCLGALTIAFITCFAASDRIMALFANRAPGIRFVFTSPTEPFFTALRVATLAALVLTFPLILAQSWLFCRPGLEEGERRLIRWAIPWAVGLFVAGSALAFAVLPLVLGMLMGLAGDDLQAMLSIRRYTTFALSSMLVMGLLFQLPLILTVAAKLGLVHSTRLRRHRLGVLLGTFAAAALLLPPDLLSQVVIVIPVLALYELTIMLLASTGR